MTIRILCLAAVLLATACDRIPDLAATTSGGLALVRPEIVPDYPDGRVLIEPEFRAFVADRRLDGTGGAWWVARSDGTVGGLTQDGREITGHWSWNGAHFCRDIRVAGLHLPDAHDCQVVTITDTGILFTADRGHGPSTFYV